MQPLPTRPKRPGDGVPMTDYAGIMAEIDIRTWVEQKGVKEVWLFAYHGGVVGLWESNMSSPHGDVSNSDRDPADLPVLSRTYTVYHYNYQRDVGEAVENHAHQIEHLLNYVDGRDVTPPEKWPDLPGQTPDQLVALHGRLGLYREQQNQPGRTVRPLTECLKSSMGILPMSPGAMLTLA